ncbi:MAG: DUF971 domain-containing protein [Acidobacteriota bacterium]
MDYPRTGTHLVELRRQPSDRRVSLTWSDGARATAPYDLLQGYCPCAHCRGHGGGEITFKEPARPVTAMEALPVGNYAVSLMFAGGCAAGIFHFDFLREIARREGLLESP